MKYADDDPIGLAARIRAGEREFSEEEFELFAECLERAPPRTSREMTALRDKVVADKFVIMRVAGGWKAEAAAAGIAENYDISRSTIFKALERHKVECEELERELTSALAKTEGSAVGSKKV